MPRFVRVTALGKTFTASTDEPILDAADRAGLRWPRGCRVGSCRTCIAALVEGDAVMPAGTALTPEDLSAYRVLLCVARATSDATLDRLPEDGGAGPAWTD